MEESVTIRLGTAVHRKLKIYAVKRGVNLTEAVAELLKKP